MLLHCSVAQNYIFLSALPSIPSVLKVYLFVMPELFVLKARVCILSYPLAFAVASSVVKAAIFRIRNALSAQKVT